MARSLLAATLGLAVAIPAHASSYTVLYSFPATLANVSQALGTVTLAAGPGGALFGTTQIYGTAGAGTVFELSPPAPGGTAWTPTTIASLSASGPYGTHPSGIAVGPDGAVYVTNFDGGAEVGYGTVLMFTPPAAGRTGWTETLLHQFHDADGIAQPLGPFHVTTDGVVYGMAYFSFPPVGAYGPAFYRLAPPSSGHGPCILGVAHVFAQGDGSTTGLSLGADGAYYGAGGGVFRLLPPVAGPTGAWTAQTLVPASGFPTGNLVEPPVGDRGLRFFGAGTIGGLPSTIAGNPGNGFIYRVSPPAVDQTAWTLTRLYEFRDGADGKWPNGVIEGPNGFLYGTASSGDTQPTCPASPGGNQGVPCGVIFSVVPTAGPLPWHYHVLHGFGGAPSDGAQPFGQLVPGTTPDGAFALFGATLSGGSAGIGTIYEIVP